MPLSIKVKYNKEHGSNVKKPVSPYATVPNTVIVFWPTAALVMSQRFKKCQNSTITVLVYNSNTVKV